MNSSRSEGPAAWCVVRHSVGLDPVDLSVIGTVRELDRCLRSFSFSELRTLEESVSGSFVWACWHCDTEDGPGPF